MSCVHVRVLLWLVIDPSTVNSQMFVPNYPIDRLPAHVFVSGSILWAFKGLHRYDHQGAVMRWFEGGQVGKLMLLITTAPLTPRAQAQALSSCSSHPSTSILCWASLPCQSYRLQQQHHWYQQIHVGYFASLQTWLQTVALLNQSTSTTKRLKWWDLWLLSHNITLSQIFLPKGWLYSWSC